MGNHAVRLAIVRGIKLADERDRLEDKLARQDAWLVANPDHPKFAQRTDQWIVNLQEYERIVDNLEDVQRMLA